MHGGKEFRARSVKPFGRGRPWVRRARAYANSIVGLTHIRGGGKGTDTATGAMTRLAFQADMGFSQGKFIGTDGQQHRGTFAFV